MGTERRKIKTWGYFSVAGKRHKWQRSGQISVGRDCNQALLILSGREWLERSLWDLCILQVLQLTITKTSGKLGPNHCHSGAWDRLRIQSIKPSKQAEMPLCTIAVYLAAQTATIEVVRHFCLEFLLVLSLQTIPSTFALLFPNQVPSRFGNGQ